MSLVAWKQRLSGLTTRIYLVGLAQFVLVTAGLVGFFIIRNRPPFQFEDTLTFVSARIAAAGADRTALAGILGDMRAMLQVSAAVYDETDHLVASDPAVSAPATRRPPSASLAGLSTAILMPDGRSWHLDFLLPRPSPIPPPLLPLIVLVVAVVGVFSFLLSRSIARPLGQLAATAHAFGSGRLDARAGVGRSDELGQLAGAFDKMADQVSRALRAEKELLANVSHELRTPLQRIHIAIDLAVEGNERTAREVLREVVDDLAELDRIVDDVLTATRLSLRGETPNVGAAASPPIRLETVRLDVLIEKSAARFRTAHPGRALRLALEGEPPQVMADAVLLRRVLDNLLDNAEKYTEDHTAEIVVVASRQTDRALIEVRDAGVGIAPDDLERVFEPFFRADRSRTRTTGGLGLGLALSRRIVEAHHGTLKIDSALGIGTTVRIELPLHPSRR